MIWRKCRLLAKQQIGEDELSNPIYAFEEVGKTFARFTPWTNEMVLLENRELTKNEQLYMIPIPFKDFPVCQRAEIDGCVFDIMQEVDLGPRWTVIQVKAYKGGILRGSCKNRVG